MCGENRPHDAALVYAIGSPPRVRGKRKALSIVVERSRITPARAGKTKGGQLRCLKKGGSPPRVRGKPDRHAIIHARLRITPACAGKTRHFRPSQSLCEDHPRVCGENGTIGTSANEGRGSPPRVRGKRYDNKLLLITARITPACAGKTLLESTRLYSPEDHPRVCGENGTQSSIFRPVVGSPPRVRGKLKGKIFFIAMCGITPACAGKTKRPSASPNRQKDHPRVCGENPTCSIIFFVFGGSPPRVRGKPRFGVTLPTPRGITPACAGKTGNGDEERCGG